MAFLAARPMVTSRPTWKYASLVRPRAQVAITAPTTPSGTTSSTVTGIDQLSYSAARHRNTIARDSAYSSGACEPDFFSSYDRPFHSRPTPAGSLATISSIAAMSSPELWPGAGAPWIWNDGTPLKRVSFCGPKVHSPWPMDENGTM